MASRGRPTPTIAAAAAPGRSRGEPVEQPHGQGFGAASLGRHQPEPDAPVEEVVDVQRALVEDPEEQLDRQDLAAGEDGLEKGGVTAGQARRPGQPLTRSVAPVVRAR